MLCYVYARLVIDLTSQPLPFFVSLEHHSAFPCSRPLDAVAPHPTEKEGLADLGKLTAYWRDNKAFRTLKGWRNELWPVYGRNGELLQAAN